MLFKLKNDSKRPGSTLRRLKLGGLRLIRFVSSDSDGAHQVTDAVLGATVKGALLNDVEKSTMSFCINWCSRMTELLLLLGSLLSLCSTRIRIEVSCESGSIPTWGSACF